MVNNVASLDAAKIKVKGLLGKQVSIRLNKGRNRVKHYSGVVQEMHSNVFVVKLVDNAALDRLSCSYIDLLCGEVALNEVTS